MDKKWTDTLIEDIVRNITDPEHMIVPIIGTGVFYVVENGTEYSIQEFIVKKVLENKDCSLDCSDNNIKKFSKGFRGMTQLSRHCINSTGTGNSFRRIVRDSLLDESNLSKIKIDPDVLLFLDEGHFPLILTTCNFHFLERYIKYDGKIYETIPYRRGKDQDIEIVKNGLTTPTIFHLFGFAGQNINVVYTEDDFLCYLHYLQDTNSRPINLKTYLEDRYILSLGCDIPDWTFRFLLYSLKEKGDTLAGHGDEKTFDGGALSKMLDDELAYFLSDISYFSDKDLNAFLKDINSRLSHDDKPSIFLSVNSEEYEKYGETIKSILSKKFKVWLFKDNGGPQYWKDIENAIKKCDYFMPVTTSFSVTKFLDPSSGKNQKDVSPGIVTELRLALEHKNKVKEHQKYCIPYVTIPPQLLKTGLQSEYCSDLWPLFYSNEGTQHITTPLELLTADEVWNYIMK